MYKNIVANFIGKFWSILSNFLFIPIYISFLGIESYSIISFTLVIVGLLAVLDSGLTATLSREFASKRNDLEEKQRIFNTLESCYFIIIIIITLIVLFFSDFVADKWLNLNEISPDKVSYYLNITSIGIAFQFLSKFYIGGMLGLERQIRANLFLVSWGATKNGLVIVVLLFYPTLEAFFLWQSAVTFIYVILLRYSILNMIKQKKSFFRIAKIDKEVLKKIGKFAKGMLLISLVMGLNSQMDKIFISKYLSINDLGFYTIASSLTYALIIIVNPISTALLPRFTSYYTSGKNEKAALLFHKVFKIVILIVFSISLVIGFNAEELLWIWIGKEEVVKNTAPLVFILSIAMSMLAIAIIPFNIAIANAYTNLNNYLGLLSLFITLPGYWIFAKNYGPIGAACVFCFVQVLITIIYTHYINIKYLNLFKTKRILLYTFLLPFLTIGIFTYCFQLIPINIDNKVLSLLWVLFNLKAVMLLSFLIFLTKNEKKYIFKEVKNILKKAQIKHL